MYEKMLQLLRSYRERSLTTQKFDRGRGKLIPKAASAKAVFTRRFRICRCMHLSMHFNVFVCTLLSVSIGFNPKEIESIRNFNGLISWQTVRFGLKSESGTDSNGSV
jgi:hypothetical protein